MTTKQLKYKYLEHIMECIDSGADYSDDNIEVSIYGHQDSDDWIYFLNTGGRIEGDIWDNFNEVPPFYYANQTAYGDSLNTLEDDIDTLIDNMPTKYIKEVMQEINNE